MSEALTNRINAEIERRLKTRQSEVDYFICLMAQNDAQSQVRITALEAEVRDLLAALEGMVERWAHLSDEELTSMPRVVDSKRIVAARAALNR